MHLLNLHNVPILKQLQIEEALLRADEREWCIINTGSPPAIVMGISGKPDKLLDLDLVKKDRIPLIRRFSGGGTVYIDPNTIFITFIKNGSLFPNEILKWTEQFYQPLFPNFKLLENDYVFGDRKFAGNAQYIQKGRWLHHTSFLWDFDPLKMRYLLLPEKRPKYRESRDHTGFLCSLKYHFPTKNSLLEKVCVLLSDSTEITMWGLPEIEPVLSLPHRKSTQITLI